MILNEQRAPFVLKKAVPVCDLRNTAAYTKQKLRQIYAAVQ